MTTTPDTIDADEIPGLPMPVAVRPTGGEVGAALPPEQIQGRPPITAAQAKVDAVASLTMSAYERAATLELTPEEAAKLQADFPDDAFQPGAAGKENLIYIEHAHLRDRFNSVFGMGKWAIVPRSRWAEPFTTKGYPGKPSQEGSRVYVEAMLIVRGCFVGEAVGAMEYYPSNAAQNYGDAVEGAKTAAFRRCAKEFGVGLQAWKKDWCQGWWDRKRSGQRSAPPRATASPARPPAAPQAASPAPTPKPAPATPKAATEATRAWMCKELDDIKDLAEEYFTKLVDPTPLMPGEVLAELPLRFVPNTPDKLKALRSCILQFGNGERAIHAYPYAEIPDPAKAAPAAAPAPAPAAEPAVEPETVDHSGMEQITGVLQKVSVKQGTSKKGPWVLYGLKVCDGWLNTFSDRLGTIAQANEGQEVTVFYTADDKGRTAHDIEIRPEVPV